MSLFDDIYSLFFSSNSGVNIEMIECLIPIPLTPGRYEDILSFKSGHMADKAKVIYEALDAFVPYKFARTKYSTTLEPVLRTDIGSIWKDLLVKSEKNREKEVELTDPLSSLLPYVVAYCKTRYSMMGSGGDKLSNTNYIRFRSVQNTIMEIRIIKYGTLFVSVDKHTRKKFLAINPMFVLRAIMETYVKQVKLGKVSDNPISLEIVARQTVNFLLLHELLHIAYGHLDNVSAHSRIFGQKMSNYSFDAYINTNIEREENIVTPDSGVKSANFAIIEVEQNVSIYDYSSGTRYKDGINVYLTGFYYNRSVFDYTEHKQVTTAGSFIGIVPIGAEMASTPQKDWSVYVNILKLMLEKGVFNEEEKKDLKKIINERNPASPPVIPDTNSTPPTVDNNNNAPKTGGDDTNKSDNTGKPKNPNDAEKSDTPPETLKSTLTPEQAAELAKILNIAGYNKPEIVGICGVPVPNTITPTASPVTPTSLFKVGDVVTRKDHLWVGYKTIVSDLGNGLYSISDKSIESESSLELYIPLFNVGDIATLTSTILGNSVSTVEIRKPATTDTSGNVVYFVRDTTTLTWRYRLESELSKLVPAPVTAPVGMFNIGDIVKVTTSTFTGYATVLRVNAHSNKYDLHGALGVSGDDMSLYIPKYHLNDFIDIKGTKRRIVGGPRVDNFHDIVYDSVDSTTGVRYIYNEDDITGLWVDPMLSFFPPLADRLVSPVEICVTGRLNYGTRDAFSTMIKKAGFYNVDSVTSNTKCLVTNFAKGTAKYNAAAALGIKILTEYEFMNLLAGIK